jgi:hypothetical protein
MKRKELFWMIMPCLLLAGAGLYYTRRANEPFRLVVDEAVLLPATPREVSEGWNAKVRVKYHLTGIFPFNQGKLNRSFPVDWQFIAPKMGKIWTSKMAPKLISGVTITSFKNSLIPGQETSQESYACLVNSRSIPKSADPLELHLTLQGEIENSSLINSIEQPYRGGHKKTPPVTLRFTLRPQPIALKQAVTKHRPFTLVGFKGTSGISTIPLLSVVMRPHNMAPDAEGKYHFRLDKIRFVVDGVEIEGAPAQIHSYDRQTPPSEVSIAAFHGFGGGWNALMTLFPQAKNVTFKADLSVGECWPMPICVVLRKDGKNIEREQPTLK